jgi:hypothetical protein
MYRSALLTLLALATLLALSGSVDAQRAEDQELLIITSASNRGEVDPCG